MPTNSLCGGRLTVLLWVVNRAICRFCYAIRPLTPPPLPTTGAVILVANHTSFSDPLVLAATAGRPIRFLMAREIYEHRPLGWIFRASGCIAVRRGQPDVRAVREMLRALGQGEALGIFPEGGIDEHREEGGYAGFGYLALKTGAFIVPAAIRWDHARPNRLLGILEPGRADVRYGHPIAVHADAHPTQAQVHHLTRTVMRAIHDLLQRAP